ncbi:MAG: 4-(cytidine 5'-diphospho)-2-C-methyl-D-erythritol kinase [Bacteroidales bacterium]|nr:4-(cytidine 5'-diphospho)-2-C-methyl-D-erythritol kinase [Bacteroidales bacterium]
MILYPNCKLNLGLHVLRRRADGYHDLETLFVPCEAYRDRLEIVPCAGEARFVGSPEVTWTDDLTMQAYRLLDAEFGLPPVEIRLEKRTPVGAGLGGGSADAAFALRALRDLFSLPLDDAALAARAARLGSDCAFFIYNRPMLGTGRGEILEPFDLDLSAWRIEVVVPAGISVSTAAAYRGIVPRDQSVISSAPSVISSAVETRAKRVMAPQVAKSPSALSSILRRPVTEWKGLLVNDFEATVFAAYPALAALKQDLYDRGAVYAAMSGSGSALFGLFEK